MAKFCARCGAKIGFWTKQLKKPEGYVCGKCFTPDEVKEFEAWLHPGPWTCSNCGMPNPRFEFVCKSCGRGVQHRDKK